MARPDYPRPLWNAETVDCTTLEQAEAAMSSGKIVNILAAMTIILMGSDAPRIETWGTSAPSIETWGTSAPSIETWGTSAPSIVTRETSAPRIETWGTSAPSIETWGTSAPSIVTRETSAPRIVTWETSAPRIETWGTSAPRIETWETSAPSIETWETSAPSFNADAPLRGDLRFVRADYFAILCGAHREVPSLLRALRDGKVNGSTYEGACACLVGTLENAGATGLPHAPSSPAELWFAPIKPNTVPGEDSEAGYRAQRALEWALEYCRLTGMELADEAAA